MTRPVGWSKNDGSEACFWYGEFPFPLDQFRGHVSRSSIEVLYCTMIITVDVSKMPRVYGMCRLYFRGGANRGSCLVRTVLDRKDRPERANRLPVSLQQPL